MTFLLGCTGKEIGDPLMNGIVHLAGSTVEIAFEDFLFVFRLNPKVKITLKTYDSQGKGEQAVRTLGSMRVDIAFIGANGITPSSEIAP